MIDSVIDRIRQQQLLRPVALDRRTTSADQRQAIECKYDLSKSRARHNYGFRSTKSRTHDFTVAPPIGDLPHAGEVYCVALPGLTSLMQKPGLSQDRISVTLPTSAVSADSGDSDCKPLRKVICSGIWRFPGVSKAGDSAVSAMVLKSNRRTPKLLYMPAYSDLGLLRTPSRLIATSYDGGEYLVWDRRIQSCGLTHYTIATYAVHLDSLFQAARIVRTHWKQ